MKKIAIYAFIITVLSLGTYQMQAGLFDGIKDAVSGAFNKAKNLVGNLLGSGNAAAGVELNKYITEFNNAYTVGDKNTAAKAYQNFARTLQDAGDFEGREQFEAAKAQMKALSEAM